MQKEKEKQHWQGHNDMSGNFWKTHLSNGNFANPEICNDKKNPEFPKPFF